MAKTTEICPLCDRPLGTQWELHHLVPKSKGGRITVALHPICHRKLHTVFTNTELAGFKGDLEPVKAHRDVAKFIKWLAKKPPDFHAPTRR
ncbi:MAG: HNH endonuclease [Sphingomonadales bacterium]